MASLRFKFIKQQHSCLSQKRNAKAFQQKVPPASGGPSAPPGSNGFNNFSRSSTPQTKVQKSNTAKAGASSGPASSHKQKPPKPSTFWTLCHRCKMQYEYLRMYLNHNLLCPNCHDPFFAIETPPPTSNGSKPSAQWNHSHQRQKNHQGASKNESTSGRNNSATPNVGSGGFRSSDSINNTNFQWGPFYGTPGASSVAQATTVVKKAEEKCMEDMGTMKRDTVNQMGTGTGGAGTAGLSGVKQSSCEPGRGGGANKIKSSRDLSHLDVQNLLMEKARTEIHKKLNECNPATMAKSAVEGKENVNVKVNEEAKVKVNAMANGSRQECYKNDEPVNSMHECLANKSPPETSSDNVDKDPLPQISINVPDPDFHDFDRDRTERCFGENQVWAAYDNDDGMPRFYAMIHNVISLNPFKMRISWLNSKTNSELAPLNWVGSGFSKTCGDFRIGKHEINNSLNSFSHKVGWKKGARGAVCVFPRKGDVWALYRNWSPDWNELTEDEVIHKYDMVEVLEDYDEEIGVPVIPLVKVAGFKTVFHRHLNPGEVRSIPREEMFRFSHRVPSYLLTGQEAPNAPKGCHELDPAATPYELLQVITDVEEDEVVETEAKVEKLSDGVGKSNTTDIEENCSTSNDEILERARETEEIKVLENESERKEEDMLVNSTEERRQMVNFWILCAYRVGAGNSFQSSWVFKQLKLESQYYLPANIAPLKGSQRQGVLLIGRWGGLIRTLPNEEPCLKPLQRRETTIRLAQFSLVFFVFVVIGSYNQDSDKRRHGLSILFKCSQWLLLIALGSKDEGETRLRVSFGDYWIGQEDAEGIDYSLGVGAPNRVKAGIKTHLLRFV
ncbi:DNAJ heat shock N-terminal domain-containing protein [Actinidia rufa]|uniref:DNAJ heat shock N-terminal domain-containing protein n=1 Tax=Actinidia rufa TaxID=165716 RepID=A0A7J0EP71_9ERIC|nr:DNAJ heat shock N-terminal domain-containing protein [Actinidia rufa]